MKKYITLMVGLALGGCVATAAPVLATTFTKKATVVVQLHDIDSDATVTMVCAPLNPDPAEQPDFK